MSHFLDYSKYYDLLYKDKNYQQEADYINELILKFHPNASSLLDIGCGTGKHASLMSLKGFDVTGVDLSQTMLNLAMQINQDKLRFELGDIRSLGLNKKFDIVTSLFHVMSYQTKNEDLYNAFESVYNHLNPEGYFIFDCWYGPGVLNDKPTTRIKKIKNQFYDIIRIGEPSLDTASSVVDVNFQILVRDLTNDKSFEILEKHPMRYFFEPEIKMLCDKFNFKFVDSYSWLSFENQTENDWYAVFILKKCEA